MGNRLSVEEVVSTTSNTTVVHGRVYEGSIRVGQKLRSINNEIQVEVMEIETYRKAMTELKEGWTGTFRLAMELGKLPNDSQTFLEDTDV